jgi:hypothetical protein
MWRPGRRMFTVSCILLLLAAAAHNTGFLLLKAVGPEDERVLDAMKGFHNQLGMGMSPSFFDLFLALAFTMTVLMVALGVIGLVLSASKSVSSEVIRTMTWLYVVWMAAFIGVGYYYRVPPPIISGIAVEASLIVALLTSNKGKEAAMSASA